jgi:hypothetical protein
MSNIGHKSGQIWQTNHFEKVDTKAHNKFKKYSKSFVYLVFAPATILKRLVKKKINQKNPFINTVPSKGIEP